MGARWLGVVVLVAACYSPAVRPGAPCGPGDSCPSGLVCEANVCVVPGSGSAMPDAWDMVVDAPSDSSGVTLMDAPIDGPPAYVPWGTPTKVASLDITGTSSDPSFTSTKLTVMMSTDSGAGTGDDIYECTRASLSTAFTCTLVVVLSSPSGDKSPEISPDGSVLYFTSARSGSWEVYKSTKSGGVWSVPVLQTDLSTAGSDSDLAISPDGLTAVVYVDDVQNHFIFSTRASTSQPFSNPVTHTELEITADIAGPCVSNGGAILYFHAGGTRDIYTATRKTSGTYIPPTAVTELNTASRDAAPFTIDDKYMLLDRAGAIFETSRP